eukprot:2077759-Alexandrium_andersonii.AAC.1
MSASLVGSEMCIRDRAHSDPSRHSSGGSRGTAPEGHQRIRRFKPLKAVSYTHLTLPTICSV